MYVIALKACTFLKKWCRPEELNPQPTDYKSVALPIELDRRLYNVLTCIITLPKDTPTSPSLLEVVWCFWVTHSLFGRGLLRCSTNRATSAMLAYLSGGPDGTRTRDLLRDRQAF